jgi:hypothetical protein
MTFDIREHTHLLEHRLIREEPSQLRYQCPICDKKTLTISKLGKGYQCWSGCLTHEIREWLGIPKHTLTNTISMSGFRKSAAMSSNRGDRFNHSIPRRVYPNPPVPSFISPIRVSPIAPSLCAWRDEARIETYTYSSTQYIQRIEYVEDGIREKTFRQYANGRLGKGQEPWDMYMWRYVPKDTSDNSIFVVEGEKCVQALWNQGLAAVSPQGSCWGTGDIKRYICQMKELGIYPVLIPDLDIAGIAKRDKWLGVSREVGWHTEILDLASLGVWTTGMDIYDLITRYTTQTLLYLYQLRSHRLTNYEQVNIAN